MRALSRLSLSARLSLFALLTLLPLAVLVVLSYLEERDRRREEGLRQATVYAQNLARSIDTFAAQLDAFMEAAALVLASHERPIDPESASGPLRQLHARYANQVAVPDQIGEPGNLLTALFITDLEGRVIAQATGDDTGLDLSSRPYVQALQAGATRVWAGVSGIRTGDLTGVYARVIAGQDGRPIAYLIAALRPANATSFLAPDLPPDANFVLIDQGGRVLVSARESGPQPMAADVSSSPLVQPALSGQLSQFSATVTPFDEGRRYGAVVPIPNMGWAVAFSRSQERLESSLQANFFRDLAIVAAVMTFTVAGLVTGTRQVLAPLRSLASAAGRIAAGERVGVPVTGSDPDVSKLQRAFGAMSTAVANREERLREQARMLQTLDQVGAWIASDLDFQKTVQAVTAAGTRLTDAQFGAFFHNVTDETGESYRLYALSGLDGQAFAGMPMPRVTDLFRATFAGHGTVRLDDVSKDGRYGKMPPHYGLPPEHPPVRSYLAVPVKSSSGATIGGLFFGHAQAGVFTERHERLASGIAAWAAIALDNARLYSQAQTMQEDLRRSNRAKDEFLALVSHELRTPTTTIYGGIRILEARRQSLTPEMMEDLVASMSEEAGRLVRLIENLLSFARLELGQELKREPLDVNAETLRVLSRPGRLKVGRRLVTDLQPDLPPVLAESMAFDEVLLNLISNADKYSPVESPVQIETRLVNGEVAVSVSDSGPGVRPEELELIFESFYRSDHTFELAKGQGLGLAVCKRLVEGQSGRIWAENRPQGGLRVSFAFPALPQPAAAEAKPGAEEGAGEAIPV